MSKQTLLSSAVAIALCDAAEAGTATCALLIPGDGGSAPDWVQLFPAGAIVTPSDGREPWKLDAAKVAAASKGELLIDYDHRTDKANDSRGAAWIEELSLTGPDGKSGGIWGRVKWNEAGGKAVASREYRYLSPTFTYDSDRNVLRILRAALTNNPALELKALASQQENNLNEDELRKLLGLPATATTAEIMAAIRACVSNKAAYAAREKQIGNIALAAGITDVTKIDDTAVTAICAKLKTSATGDVAEAVTLRAEVDKLNKTVATLSAKSAGTEASVVVDQAIKDGKIIPAQRDWAVGYASREPEAFAEFIKKQPAILTGGRIATTLAEGALTDEEKAMCVMTGLSEEAFKKTRAAEVAQKASA